MIPANQFYEEKIKSYASDIQAVQGRMTFLAMLRFVAFAGFAGAVYWWVSSHAGASGMLVSLVVLAVFIILVRYYFRLRDKKALLQQLLWVNQNEQGIMKGIPNGLPDGNEWLDGESYLDDLDIFGARSLFHLLNRTTTSHGKQRLAEMLCAPMLEPASIIPYQEAVKVMTSQPEKRQLLTAYGLLAEEKDGNLKTLGEWLTTPGRLLKQGWLLIGRWILIAYNLGAILYYLSTDKVGPMLLGIVIGWIITGSFTSYISKQHLLIGKKQAILDQYASILAVFNSIETGDAALLRSLRERTEQAHKAIKQLSQLSGMFDQRMNILVNMFFNSFLLYDVQCMIALERWKARNSGYFGGWIEAVGAIESLNSLASFAYNNPQYAYPVPVAEGALYIEATAIAHPLIPGGVSVANDCLIGRDERLVLVTGSNMSGKTTFLRTIGVNMLLAQCGAPVAAKAFTFTPMRLLTSLRVSDSLQEQTSYFMAELKKLQRIVHQLQTGQPALVLIDEILRGTNSEDKTFGSEQFIKKLLLYNCLSLFATHDLTLGTLEQELPGQISNYCFESVIEHGELYFNYILQRGVARNRNASFLMQKMEII